MESKSNLILGIPYLILFKRHNKISHGSKPGILMNFSRKIFQKDCLI